MSLDTGRESLEAPSAPKAPADKTLTPNKTQTDAPPAQDGDTRARMDRILNSDIGVNTLLVRLKQSISSAKEFSSFLKERAALEEKNAHGLIRLTRGTQEILGRPDNRQGSFAHNYREIGVVHEKMAKNSEDFAHNLLAMSEELQELASHCERSRKQAKHFGLEAEQKAQDADSAMEKAKQKYYSFAEQYDRVRTGERQGGRFGLKGPKSAAQNEESLLSKAEYADQEYRSRVEAAQSQRHELLNTSRPQALRDIQNLIMECDAALSMQLQKFAVMNEKLLLGNGLCVSPLKDPENATSPRSRSLREVAQAVNNQKDFEDYVLSHSGRVGPPPAEIKYEKHSALVPSQHYPPSQPANTFNPPPRSDTGFGSMRGPTGPGAMNTGPAGPGPVGPGPGPGPMRPGTTGSGPMGSESMTTGSAGYRSTDRIGQTTGVVSRTPPQPQGPYSGSDVSAAPQQGSYPSPRGPGMPSASPQGSYQGHYGSSTSTAPQLPQMGALSMGAKKSMEGGRPDQSRGYNDGEQRDFTGPPSQRLGQTPYSGQPNMSPGSSAHHQVTSTFGQPTAGPRGNGIDGDHSLSSNPQSYDKAPQQNMSFNTGRGASLGQAAEFRTDGRGPPHAQGYQVPIGPGYQPSRQDTQGMSDSHDNNTNYGAPGPGGLVKSNTSSNIGQSTGNRGPNARSNLPPLRPVFGVSLDELFRRDGAAVPAIVYQCVQAVDLFGLKTEGIYRISGSAQHIMELQALFDHDSSQVDFRNRAAFYNDIASVTTLLKHFLRDLPDPLLTSAQYNQFIQAAKIPDDIVRRDSLHAIINSLPDPNYATLRTVVLHLYRVAQHSSQNRMTTSNLAIVFGPTLMGGHHGAGNGEIQDAGYQARVVETILNNTLEVFDDDD